jgi:SpoIID/LytB domain protein
VPPNDAESLSAHTESARLAIDRRRGCNAMRRNSFTGHNKNTVTNIGQSHGVGLCQRGATEMAQQHATCNEIIAHYLPGAQLQHAAARELLASK